MKVLIIGGGRIALSHIPQLLSYDNIEIVGVVDRSFKSRFAINNLFKIRTFKNIPSISFDCVFILTPPQYHFEYLEMFLNMRIPVFCEKPVAITKSEAARVKELSVLNDVYLQGGYVYRFNPTFSFLKKRIEESNVITNVSVLFEGYVETDEGSWRESEKHGSILYEYGSHAIDLLIYLFGDDLNVDLKNRSTQITDKNEKKIFFSSERIPNEFIECRLNWKNDKLRKAEMTINCQCDNDLFQVSDMVVMRNGSNITTETTTTDCSFYLRGENFSNQSTFFRENYNKGFNLAGYNPQAEILLDEISGVIK